MASANGSALLSGILQSRVDKLERTSMSEVKRSIMRLSAFSSQSGQSGQSVSGSHVNLRSLRARILAHLLVESRNPLHVLPSAPKLHGPLCRTFSAMPSKRSEERRSKGWRSVSDMSCCKAPTLRALDDLMQVFVSSCLRSTPLVGSGELRRL
jgi:hypothetical protein